MTPITSLSQLDPNGTYSYADYLSWQFNEFVELIKGKLMRPMAGPSVRHQELSQRLELSILSFLRGSRCRMFHAPLDVRLTRSTGNGDAQIRTVVQPDIFVVCDPGKLDERGCLGAPDWIIEILSPGNTSRDTKTKFDLYEENGVREYWIVIPGLQTIQTYQLDEAGEYQPSGEYAEPGLMPVATLPGLTIDWREVFDEGPSGG
ncbi:Uma2 family endonuclease [Hymenobacter sp. ASUV-10]|uniref:Uma2 family endonuclease n=1 Tax=Hymenobacter aranciens TaxID=3063996 RepID=A0ABT9BA85_9BACT|nr:Uma2 family endonuclease [Hymenobacter sp. ASUV-10]MDO7875180.1 Uma2 family endonuclease [Hymenobacter sp. ASUV-10]